MSDYNLGTARGLIVLDYKGNGASEKASEDIDKISKSGDGAKESMSKVSTAAIAGGAAIVGGLGLAVKTAADFEKGLSGIKAVSGATTEQMDGIRKMALRLGADTSFSASEASTAMEELVKAGVPIESVMNGAADAAVALAEAGGVDLPQAATIAANAMNQFGLSAEQLPGIVDQIAGAANVSAIDVSDLGMSMSQVGAVANLAGLSFEDTALAITAMGNAGIKGSDAGTSLKSMLMNLQPTTEKQVGLMQELGIVTEDGANQFFDAEGKIRSMADIAGVLGTALQGMSQEQKMAALETMFGSDAIRAAAVIAEQGADGMNKLSTEIGKVSAADVAKTRMDNMAGSVEELKGSVETLAIGLGTVLIPPINTLVEKLTTVVNWFGNLSEGQQKAIVIISLFVAALLLIIGVMVKVALVINTVKTTMIALNATFLANPITWIILAVVALIAALVLLWKNSETFRNIVKAVWEGIKKAIGAVADWITGTAVPAITAAWDWIKDKAQALWNGLKSIFDGIKQVFKIFTDGDFTGGPFEEDSGVVDWAFKIRDAVMGVINFFKAAWNGLVAVVSWVFNAINTVISTVVNVILTVWQGFWGLFGGLITAAWNLAMAIINYAIQWIVAIITTYMNLVIGFWKAVWNGIVLVVTTVWNAISSAVSAAAQFIWNIISSVFNTINGIIRTVLNAVWSFIVGVWNNIRDAISGPINAAMNIVSSVVNRIKDAISNAFNNAKSAATNAFNGLRDSVGSIIDSVFQKVNGVKDRIINIFSGAIGWLKDAGRNIIQGLLNGIESLIDSVTSKLNWLTDLIPKSKGPIEKDRKLLKPAGKAIIQGLIDSMAKEFPKVEALLQYSTDRIPTAATIPVFPSARPPQEVATQQQPTNVYVNVDAPQNMSPDEVALASARRFGYAMGAGATQIPKVVTG